MRGRPFRAAFLGGAILCGALAGLFACSDDSTDPPPVDSMPDRNSAAAKTLSPLPPVPPADPTNKVADNPLAAKLGQMLFFDKSYSGALTIDSDGKNGGLGAKGETGKVSCASCHIGVLLDDQRSKPGNVSIGTGLGTRRALSLVNSSFYAWTNWGGRFDSQWSLPLAVAEKPEIMGGTRLQVVHAIYAKYKDDYEKVFSALDPRIDTLPPIGMPKKKPTDADGPWELMSSDDQTIANNVFVNFGKAIAAYLRTLVSRNAPFDKYAAGDRAAISEAADRGFSLFLGKAQCIACHNGPHFSDGEFHAIGVPQAGPNVPDADLGRYADVPTLLGSKFNTNSVFSDDKATHKLDNVGDGDGGALPSQKGQFRTKSLRGVGVSGPYMHAGQLPTLEEVVAFYNLGGRAIAPGSGVKDTRIHTLDLTPQEIQDLVEFLRTLTGEPVPAPLTVDTSKP